MSTDISVTKNNNSVFSQGIIESKLKINSSQMDILAILLAEIGKSTDVDANLEYSITVQNYAYLNDIGEDAARKLLGVNICGAGNDESMRTIGFEMYMSDGGFEHYNWFEKIIYHKGVATFVLTPDMKRILVEFKHSDKYKIYTKLRYILPMRSIYSKRIYLMCREILGSKDIGSRYCDTDWELFKEKLQIPTSYKYNHIKKRILDVAVKEINETSDILISYKMIEIEENGKIIPKGIKFDIKSKCNVDTGIEDNIAQEEKLSESDIDNMSVEELRAKLKLMNNIM